MSESKPRPNNTGFIIALVVGLVLLVPCVIGLGLAVVGGGMAFFMSSQAIQEQMDAMPPRSPTQPMEAMKTTPVDVDFPVASPVEPEMTVQETTAPAE